MLKFLKWLAIVIGVAAILVVVARFVFPLPDRSKITPSSAMALAADTGWGRFLKTAAETNPGKSGVMPLKTGHEALAARLLLAKRAERSIDLQYYIWHDDTSGRLLLKALHDAAKRGVRVRLLVDDNGVPGLDDLFSALDAVKNLDVRIFNPSRIRTPKLLGYTFDFFRMNRRMHNKAFIVDGAAAIIGGRNIGDEYFAIGDDNYFLDLDALAAGAIVPETAANFDRYWNSESVYPIDLVTGGPAPALPDWLMRDDAIEAPDWVAKLPEIEAKVGEAVGAGASQLEWTDVKLVSDDPSKGLGKASGDQLMVNQIGKAIGPITKSLDLISAYFIPGKRGVEFFTDVQKSGAKVEILTNSLMATDVAMVHAGYTKYRRDLLEAGISLYELKPQPGVPEGQDELSLLGSSGSSLHAKSLSIDEDRIFIGSFNFDPRSASLNTEMGVIFKDPRLVAQMRTIFRAQTAPECSYQVALEGSRLVWNDTAAAGARKLRSEPGAGFGKRLMATAIGLLPIESQL